MTEADVPAYAALLASPRSGGFGGRVHGNHLEGRTAAVDHGVAGAPANAFDDRGEGGAEFLGGDRGVHGGVNLS